MQTRMIVRTGNPGRGRRLTPGMVCTYTTLTSLVPVLVVALDDDPAFTWVMVLMSGQTVPVPVAPAWLGPRHAKTS
jgi:hypothetical protein